MFASLFMCMFVGMYKSSLLFFGAVMGFATRNVKATFNESTQIAWAIYNAVLAAILSISIIVFINAIESTLNILVQLFMLWLVCWTWSLLFVPKFHLLYSQSEAETVEASRSELIPQEKSGGFSFASIAFMSDQQCKMYFQALRTQIHRCEQRFGMALTVWQQLPAKLLSLGNSSNNNNSNLNSKGNLKPTSGTNPNETIMKINSANGQNPNNHNGSAGRFKSNSSMSSNNSPSNTRLQTSINSVPPKQSPLHVPLPSPTTNPSPTSSMTNNVGAVSPTPTHLPASATNPATLEHRPSLTINPNYRGLRSQPSDAGMKVSPTTPIGRGVLVNNIGNNSNITPTSTLLPSSAAAYIVQSTSSSTNNLVPGTLNTENDHVYEQINNANNNQHLLYDVSEPVLNTTQPTPPSLPLLPTTIAAVSVIATNAISPTSAVSISTSLSPSDS